MVLALCEYVSPVSGPRVSQNQVGQNFTFVLTDIDGKQRFGFCRLTQGCRVCICLLSYVPWFEIYYKLLNTLADYLTKQQENDLNDMLNSLYDLPVPKPFTPVNLSVHSYFIAPDINGLPTIPESRNLTEYFVAVDVNNMLQLYASMLHERRIIITSSKLSTLQLSAALTGTRGNSVEFLLWLLSLSVVNCMCPRCGCSALSYVLAAHLHPCSAPASSGLLLCPMPYFVGVHLSLLEKVRSRSLEDVVILNVDTNTLESPLMTCTTFPVSSLKSKLKKQSTATGSGVARSFLRAQAALFGSYRDALRYKPGEPITFCEESFANHRSSTMKNFLSMAVNLQLFKQFIDGRLAKLNAGRGFSDVFEEEITEGGFCGSNSRSYQQWMHTVKRGGALINTAVTKAKSHAKRGIRDFKGRLKAREEEEEWVMVCAGSPTSTKSLSPRRLQKMRRQNFNKYHVSMGMGPRDLGYGLEDDELDSASKISSEDSGDVPSYIEDSDDSYSLELDMNSSRSGQMNLLEEILDSLNTTTIEQGKLSAAKSLDFFRASPPSSECPPADESDGGGGGDQSGWNMGQDDSAVHGKHLPPSPRRQPNKSSLKVAKKLPVPTITATSPLQEATAPTNSTRTPTLYLQGDSQETAIPTPLSHRVTPPSPSLTHTYSSPAPGSQPNSSPVLAARARTVSDPQGNADPLQGQNQSASTSILRRKVLSKETVRYYQEKALQRKGSKGRQEGSPSRQSHAAMQIPWEKEVSKEGLLGFGMCLGQGRSSGGAVVQDQGLLEEIDSMCCLGSVLHSSLQLSQVHCNNTPHPLQSNNTDEA
ncbi:hypothetical protein F7725_027865 [Dissostichus mawsoni]|uniref:UDENN domain-containing protein n=1 Tax=Dissostichus mawsoni TaxID=36200 RepID=A0A7J5XFF4_DISMA|nr:hypothetical protein F7725_027865 [Dissostichus mawsoni]